MSKKMTAWFQPNVKPMRKGIYQTHFDRESKADFGYSFWSGERWGTEWAFPSQAMRAKDMGSGYQDKFWRGLASKPAKDSK